MTESEWLLTSDPLAMLDEVFPVRSLDSAEPQSRACRLYLLGCARLAWNRLPGVCRALAAVALRVYGSRVGDRTLRDAVYPHAEAIVTCRGTADEVNAIGRELAAQGLAELDHVLIDKDIAPELWSGFAHLVAFPFFPSTPHFRRIPAYLHSAALVREVFGYPFAHQPQFAPRWRTETATALARHVEATGDFSVLPVLADALQDAGCDRDDVLAHLRSGAPHAPGCWALELVLNER